MHSVCFQSHPYILRRVVPSLILSRGQGVRVQSLHGLVKHKGSGCCAQQDQHGDVAASPFSRGRSVCVSSATSLGVSKDRLGSALGLCSPASVGFPVQVGVLPTPAPSTLLGLRPVSQKAQRDRGDTSHVVWRVPRAVPSTPPLPAHAVWGHSVHGSTR